MSSKMTTSEAACCSYVFWPLISVLYKLLNLFMKYRIAPVQVHYEPTGMYGPYATFENVCFTGPERSGKVIHV